MTSGWCGPLIRQGRKLFAWLASVGHWLDIGGNVPGGYNPQATECFQEGVLIPPVKLFRSRRASSRTSSTSSRPTAACRAPTGATSTASSTRSTSARSRFHALIDEYGDDVVAAALDLRPPPAPTP
jgi:N-methylhydantoinase B